MRIWQLEDGNITGELDIVKSMYTVQGTVARFTRAGGGRPFYEISPMCYTFLEMPRLVEFNGAKYQ